METIIKKIIEEYFEKWTGVVFSFLGSFILYVCMEQKWQKMDNRGIYIKILFVTLVAINIIHLGRVYRNYYIPRAAKNKIGLLVNIDAEDRNTYKETKRKFGDEFKRCTGKEFDVIFIPIERTINFKKHELFINLIKRKRCVLYLRIIVNTNRSANENGYELQVGATILHRKYEDNIKEQFQNEFISQLNPVSHHVFDGTELLTMMRVTAARLSLACSYVIGLSFFLNGELVRSQEILIELRQLLYQQKNQNKMLKRVDCLLYDIFMTKAMIYSQSVLYYPNDVKMIKRMDECINEANKYVSNTPTYYLNKAYCDVALDRIDEAKSAINLCKQLCMQTNNREQRWKYSEAFLNAYENKSLAKIVQSYSNAFKVQYDLQDLIMYIEMIVERRPERNGLFLALGMLYEENGDVDLAKENYDIYIEQQFDKDKTLAILKKKGKYCFG